MKTLRIAVLAAAVAVPSLAFAQDQQTNPPPPVGGVGGALGGAAVGGVVGGPVGAVVGAGVGLIVGSSLPRSLLSPTPNPWWWDKRCRRT